MKTQSEPVQIKIAYIGGGSRAWALKLIEDLALCPHLAGELRLYDIDYKSAVHNEKVANIIFSRKDAARGKFKARPVKTARAALSGADFVVMSVEPGPTRMRYADLVIPEKFGIIQPVGDTIGPGGIMRSLRSVPIYTDYAHKIMKYCPNAWVINYTNPMTLCTASLYAAEPDIKAFGCCHEVFGTQSLLATLAKKWYGLRKAPPREEIELDISGVNHFTWITSAKWENHDIFANLRKIISDDKYWRNRSVSARRRMKAELWYECDGDIAFDLLRRFGALGAAGDRHLSEFVPWYLTSEKELNRYGVILTPYSWRLRRSNDPRVSLHQAAKKKLELSGEEGVAQMCAILGVDDMVTNVNLPNTGQNSQLPIGAVVESYASFTRDSVRPVVCSPLPDMAANLVSNVAAVQRNVLAAAMTKDVELAFAALLNDSLVNIPVDRARKMFIQQLQYTKSMLSGWKIPSR